MPTNSTPPTVPFRPASTRVKAPRAGSETGSAFMEFFFALPFLLFTMVLGMNFCKVYLMQQRVMAAARYVAWSDVQHQTPPGATQLSNLFFGGAPVQVSSVSRLNSDEAGSLNRVSSDLSGSAWGGLISSALSRISGTQSYSVQYHYRPLFAAGDYFGNGNYNWYPDLQISGTIATDSKDWRYPDMSFKQIVGDFFRALGSLL